MMTAKANYDFLLNTLSKKQWERIGVKRRAGVAVPLFSLYSSKSLGIGELPDLKLLVDWCVLAGMSLIQLLPMNDVGFNFRPYDARSMFALDPMYLSLNELEVVDTRPFKNEIKNMQKSFPVGLVRVNYEIKTAKLTLLQKIFNTVKTRTIPSFQSFIKENAFWLQDYALFKVIKGEYHEKAWEEWSDELKERNSEALLSFKKTHTDLVIFHQWLQWQLFEQFVKVKEYAQRHGVFLTGDLPFLVSRDSADVWAHQEYFKLALSSGAPPDMLYSRGQRWGMPPYDWERIAKGNYDYIIAKLKYAQNFYDLYRLDHVVGIFRVWTIPLTEPMENNGLYGTFDPQNPDLWEEHGRRLLSIMIENSKMLASAEDLGTIPDCSYKVLKELGIPGIDVQRWARHWNTTGEFKDPGEYRKVSLATLATHDMSSLYGWWEFEAGTVDENLFKRKCREKNIPFDAIRERLFNIPDSLHGRLRWKKEIADTHILLGILEREESSVKDLIDLYRGSFDEKEKFLKWLALNSFEAKKDPTLFVKRTLEKINNSTSIFSIQLLYDYLSLDSLFEFDPWELRINFPGTISDKNWTLVMPLSLEDMLTLPINRVIKAINQQSQRI
jgi:4-alpha-glucanotransferase